MNISLSPFAPENLVSRDGFGNPVPSQPAHLQTKAESGHGIPPCNVCMVITYSKGMNQPGNVAKPARGQLNRENKLFLSPFAPDNLVSRDRFARPVQHQLAHFPYSG